MWCDVCSVIYAPSALNRLPSAGACDSASATSELSCSECVRVCVCVSPLYVFVSFRCTIHCIAMHLMFTFAFISGIQVLVTSCKKFLETTLSFAQPQTAVLVHSNFVLLLSCASATNWISMRKCSFGSHGEPVFVSFSQNEPSHKQWTQFFDTITEIDGLHRKHIISMYKKKNKMKRGSGTRHIRRTHTHTHIVMCSIILKLV